METIAFIIWTLVGMGLVAYGIYTISQHGLGILAGVALVFGLAIGIIVLNKSGLSGFMVGPVSGKIFLRYMVVGWILTTGTLFLAALAQSNSWSDWIIYPSWITGVVFAALLILFTASFTVALKGYNLANPIISAAKPGFFLRIYPWLLGISGFSLFACLGSLAYFKFAKNVPAAALTYTPTVRRIAIASVVALFVIGTAGKVATKASAQVSAPTEVAVAATDAPVEATYPAEATMTAIMPTDTPIPTASPLPQPTFTPITSTATPIPPTATLVPTAAPRDFSEYPSCLETTETQHPDDGHTLINIPNPFPGARLEIEIYSKVDCVLTLNPGEYANMAWWSHGPYDDNKTLSKPCLNGPKCEGVAVLFRTDIIPAYEIVHVYIYLNGSDAVISFLGSNNDSPEERGYWNDGQSSSFACRTLKNSLIYGYHDNQNIVVPEWAKDAASIFYHTGCEGFDGKPGKDNPEPATDAVCAAPQSENWLWYSGGFWYHDGLEINFTVPMGISKVLYRTTDSGYPYIVAMTGESVSGATYAYAYCNNE